MSMESDSTIRSRTAEDAEIAADYERERLYQHGPDWRMAKARMLDRLSDGWLRQPDWVYYLDSLGEIVRERAVSHSSHRVHR